MIGVVVLSRIQVENLKPVRAFLDSKGRNSTNTRKAYLTALVHFNNLSPNDTAETILKSLSEEKINVYELLDSFVEDQSKKVSPKTLRLHLAAVESYLGYHDIDIIPARFKKKVTVPKLHREDEQAIDASDIRKILLVFNNRRLKSYLLVLASGGMRTVEALATRIKDIDFTVSPTKVHVRREYAKTRVARDIYISDEATYYLKQWIDWKRKTGKPKAVDDLVFGVGKGGASVLYFNIASEFSKNLELAGFTERKENSKRHRITLNSFRRFVDSTITDLAGKDYAEWFLGHAKSSYYTKKEPERREIYTTKCMKYLTFLDYTTWEARGKSIEANLQEKDREMQALMKQVKQTEQQLEESRNDIQSFKQDMQEMRGQLENGIKYRNIALNEITPDWRQKYYNEWHKLSDEELQKVKALRRELGEIGESDMEEEEN